MSAEASEPFDKGVEAAWSEEIKRRIDEIDSGNAEPIPWEEARRQISALFNGR
jgi:putative addiction module component (TIGR02574 family)